MIGGRRPLQGRKLGDKRIRVERPHAAYFRWTGPGQLTAKESASGPTTGRGRAQARVKAMFLGRPLASEEELGERLSKKKALAIFSSDAISSSAYATEEILRALVIGGRRGARVRARDQRRDRRAADRRRDQLPPGLPRLPDRRRQLLRLEAELRLADVAGRRVGAADRLRDDGRGLDVVGRRADHIGVPRPLRRTRPHRRRLHRPDHDRQPPRAPRGGQHLRPADVPVPVRGAADDRDRHVPDRRPRRGPGRTRRSSSRAATRSRPSR